jgi:hypothetical protein
MKHMIGGLVVFLCGCQTTLDPNYALQLESYRLTIQSQQNVEVAKAKADEARYIAMATIAERGGPQAQQLAILALALGGRGVDVKQVNVSIPTIPESQEDRALKWAAIFAGPITSVAQGYFGYRLGVTQSNNQANSTIASYNALGLTALGGFSANQNIAGGAFNVVDRVSGSAFGALPGLKPTLPSITINGNGVVGSGRYTGDNSGANSGNSGRINSPDTTTTQRTCNGGTTDAAGNAGAQC